jgi:small subunit ribosomal protein S17
MAHDEEGACREGDTVAIVECRPISKRKAWRVIEIVERAQVETSA